ncbi:MAG: replication-associated recombination protein A [Lentisphaerae bacterium]|jgi:putative ATPase|nr:replication-associated recombination protein A [Lentisphaerota bacterium]
MCVKQAQKDLFETPATAEEPVLPVPERAPLAARMRPESLEDVVGQDHILGPGRLLRRVIEADRLTNLIFFGPPGCGKTSLAEVIARTTRRRFERCSGVLSNVATLRNICETARLFRDEQGTLLFIDEIHRFNKAQQDVLLPYVEDGTVTLIGATTHNPQVFINTPLTSRSLVFELRALDREAVRKLLDHALRDTTRGLGTIRTEVAADALDFLADICEGDARRALTALEVAVLSTVPDADGIVRVDTAVMEDCVQRRMITYDRDEDGHYDTISAFIKSLRGSDPHAALYWLAKMLEAGEDPRFIARRMMIFASEDVGNADPRGLTLSVAAMQASEYVGMPEARIILAHATTYLATAPKSNASYLGIEAALGDVRNGRILPVPEHLKNRHIKAEGKAAPAAYKYPHDFEGHHVDQEYIPTSARYYKPGTLGYEDTIGKRMKAWEAARGKQSGDS